MHMQEAEAVHHSYQDILLVDVRLLKEKHQFHLLGLEEPDPGMDEP